MNRWWRSLCAGIFNIAAMESLPGKTIKHRLSNSRELVRWCTAQTFQWCSRTWNITGMHRDEVIPAVWKTFISYLLISSRSLLTHSSHIWHPCKSICQLIFERSWRAQNEEISPANPSNIYWITANVEKWTKTTSTTSTIKLLNL